MSDDFYGEAPKADEKPVESQSFASRRITSAEWNPNTGDLTVTFIRGDQRTYEGVPEYIWRGLLSAPSAGRYFGQVIAGSFTEF